VALRLRQQDLDRGGRLRRGQAGGGCAGGWPPHRDVHLLRIGIPEVRAATRARGRRGAGQHLERRLVRSDRGAAENRRWLLRATNDGITATIDPAGRVRGTLPPYIEAASTTGFSYIAGETVYTRFGDWFPLLCAAMAAACLIAERAM
jgi:hypothetical protein